MSTFFRGVAHGAGALVGVLLALTALGGVVLLVGAPRPGFPGGELPDWAADLGAQLGARDVPPAPAVKRTRAKKAAPAAAGQEGP